MELTVPVGVDPAWYAMSKFRTRQFDQCTKICSDILLNNPYDQAIWLLKCRSLTMENYIDDCEMDDSNISQSLLDDNSIAEISRPGTSMTRPQTRSSKPSSSYRPTSGFLRPGSSSSRPSSSQLSFSDAYKGHRPGTSTTRPMTAFGREIRLGTASIAFLSSPNGPFIDLNKIDVSKFAKKPALAMALTEYLIYHETNPKLALRLCHESNLDGYWKYMYGKCLYRLGLFRDALAMQLASIQQSNLLVTTLDIVKTYIALDQPKIAISTLEGCLIRFPHEALIQVLLGRLHFNLNDIPKCLSHYSQALILDSSHMEALSVYANLCMDDGNFISALACFTRMIHLYQNTDDANAILINIAVCVFMMGDVTYAALILSNLLTKSSTKNDDEIGHVLYNLGHVMIESGQGNLSYMAWFVANSYLPNDVSILTNLGVLEMKRGNNDAAKNWLNQAVQCNDGMFEPHYNLALLEYRGGNFQEAFQHVQGAMKLGSKHGDMIELYNVLRQQFIFA